MLKIDFHNHVFTKSQLAALCQRQIPPRMEHMPNTGHYTLVSRGFTANIGEEFYDPEARLTAMDRDGIDIQVISPASPWVDMFDQEEAVMLARKINNEIAAFVAKNPKRFAGLATLPFKQPEAAVDELRRCIDELQLRGFIMGTNIDGKPIDSPDLQPVLQEATQLDVPIFIHPTPPGGIREVLPYRLVTLVAFVCDTTMAIARLTLSGVLVKLPNLKLVVAHLGGTIPYVAGRIDKGYQKIGDCRLHISNAPSSYMRRLYADSVVYDVGALRCGLDFFTPDRVVYGSDYPFEESDPRGIAVLVKGWTQDQVVQDRIFHHNASKLLKI
ncbi:MAG: amidohydrolase family protein [Candidatus Bathyarchaeia archaeon]